MSKLLTDDIDNRQAVTKNGIGFSRVVDWVNSAMSAYLVGNDKLAFTLIDNSIRALEQLKKDIEDKREADE